MRSGVCFVALCLLLVQDVVAPNRRPNRKTRTTTSPAGATPTSPQGSSRLDEAYANGREVELEQPPIEMIYPQSDGLPLHDGELKFDAGIYCHEARVPTKEQFGPDGEKWGLFGTGQPEIERLLADNYDTLVDNYEPSMRDSVSAALRTLDLVNTHGGGEHMPDAVNNLLSAISEVRYHDDPAPTGSQTVPAAVSTSTEYPGDWIWPRGRDPAKYTSLISLCRNTKWENPSGLGCKCLRPGTSSIVVCKREFADPILWRTQLPRYCQLECYCRVWAMPRRAGEPGAYLTNIKPGVNMDTRSGGMVMYFESKDKKPIIYREPKASYNYETIWVARTQQCSRHCVSQSDCGPDGECKCLVSKPQWNPSSAVNLFVGICGLISGRGRKRSDTSIADSTSICPCNQTYVSRACCFDELVWEDSSQKRGEMASLIDAT